MTARNLIVFTKRCVPATMLGCAGFMITALLPLSTAQPTTQLDDAFSTHQDPVQVEIQNTRGFATPMGDSTTTKATIEGYFSTLKQKKGWDSFLADDMVFTQFTSPVKRVSGKAKYLESTKPFYSGIIAFEIRDLLVEGDKACALTRYQLQRPQSPAFESNIAEVFRVRDGQIVSFEIYFDSAPFPK